MRLGGGNLRLLLMCVDDPMYQQGGRVEFPIPLLFALSDALTTKGLVPLFLDKHGSFTSASECISLDQVRCITLLRASTEGECGHFDRLFTNT